MTVTSSWRDRLRIDKRLVAPKFTYLLLYSSTASVSPFLSVYLATFGLSSFETGVIMAVKPFMVFIGAPLFAALADRMHAHKRTLVTCLILSTTVRSLFVWVRGFAFFMLLAIAAEFISSPVSSLLDSGVLAILGPTETKKYGQQRLFGAIGWGSAALLVGMIVDASGDDSWHFYMQVIFMSLTLIPLAFMRWVPRAQTSNENATRVAAGRFAFFRPLMRVLRDPSVAAFFASVFIYGCLMCLVNVYLFVYLRRIGGGSVDATLLGLSLAFTCIAEVPFFFFASPLLRRFSTATVLVFALVVYAIRLTYYSFLWTPWAVLPAELLHGITYAASWAAMTEHINKIAPPGLHATMQALLTALMWGLGLGIGTLIAGVVYDAFGPLVLYRAGAVLALTAAGIFAVAQPRGAFARPAPIKVQDDEALVQLDEDDDDEQLLLDEAALHDEDERDGI